MRGFAFIGVAVLLSGCASGGSQDTPSPSFIVVTAPSDYSAENATNDAPHLHDYWGGREQLTIVDEPRQAAIGLNSQRITVAEWQPPGQVVVPQGTSRVELRIDWTPNPDDVYARPEVWVRTAQDREPVFLSALAKGKTVTLITNNTANDVPHQELSAWMVQVKMSPPDASPFMRFNGKVHLNAVAFRGIEIPLYPAHPDQWRNRDEIPLFNTGGQTNLWLHEDNICLGACLGHTHVPVEGAVVPLDYDFVEIKLRVQANTPNTLGLAYHPADARAFVRLAPVSEAGGVRAYEIAGARGDGAYALQTMWDFGVIVEKGPEQAYSGAYEFEAIVHRLPKA